MPNWPKFKLYFQEKIDICIYNTLLGADFEKTRFWACPIGIGNQSYLITKMISNVSAHLASKTLATRSLRFMDAYRKGLHGHQAAWAAKKYRGHRVIPASLLKDLEKAKL